MVGLAGGFLGVTQFGFRGRVFYLDGREAGGEGSQEAGMMEIEGVNDGRFHDW